MSSTADTLASPAVAVPRSRWSLYELLIGEDDARFCRDIPETQCQEQPRSFVRHLGSQALSKTGDTLADSKVVLPWLLGAVGAPFFLVALLVPIRESLALMPQILFGGIIRRFTVRKNFWVFSSVIEGLCVILMGAVALAGLRGAAAGWTIIALLVVFSLSRGVASIAGKDTLAKTIAKGKRGRVSGYAGTISGVVATLVGLYLVLSPESARPQWLLYAILVAAGVSWLLAALTFWTINEHPGATEGGRGLQDLLDRHLHLLRDDRDFQRYLITRTLMLSTALVGPVYVSLAQRESDAGLAGLGWLVVASGAAGAVSSATWGALSDRSSRITISVAALIASLLGFAVLASLALESVWSQNILFYAAVVFILGVSHAGVRIGRKTHLVDLAKGENTAEYVALSNTVIGILLLAVGALVSVLLAVSVELTLGVLSVMALIGGGVALTMKDTQD